MKKDTLTVVHFCLLIVFFSCSQQNLEKNSAKNNFSRKLNNEQKEDSLNELFTEVIKDTVVFIKLSNGLSFRWNNKSSRIIEDSDYKYIVSHFEENKYYLINQIMNLSKTSASVCGKSNNMVIGDFAFLIIDKISVLPSMEILETQLDAYNLGCSYPIGYFKVIENDRKGIKDRLEYYFKDR